MKDKMAVLISGLCLVHCFLPPVIISVGMMSFAGNILESEWVHIALLCPVVVLAVLSLPSAYRRHRTRWPMVLAVLGITGFCSAFLLPEAMELWITVVAAGLMILAHVWNRVLLQRRPIIMASPQVLARVVK